MKRVLGGMVSSLGAGGAAAEQVLQTDLADVRRVGVRVLDGQELGKALADFALGEVPLQAGWSDPCWRRRCRRGRTGRCRGRRLV